MLLVVDQGNSDVVFGLHDGQDWIAEWRTPTTDKNQSAYQVLMRQWLLEAGINPSNVNQAIISSVVPDQRTTVIDFVTNLFAFKPVVLNQQLYQKLGLELNSPHEIGSDLVANAMAAAHMFPDSCSIVVDFGTALTLTSVSGRKILGVSIAPGLKTAVSSLFSHTAQLRKYLLKYLIRFWERTLFMPSSRGYCMVMSGWSSIWSKKPGMNCPEPVKCWQPGAEQSP